MRKYLIFLLLPFLLFLCSASPGIPTKYYVSYTAPDQGASSRGSLKYLIDAIGTKNATIVFPHTLATTQTTTGYTFSTNETCPANITIEVEHGAVLTFPTGGIKLTQNGPFKAELAKCLAVVNSTTGLILGGNTQGHPEWWADNLIPGSSDFTLALKSVVVACKNIALSDIYKTTEAIPVPDGRVIRGISPESSIHAWGCDGLSISSSDATARQDLGVEITGFLLSSYTTAGVARTYSNTATVNPANIGIKIVGGPYLVNQLLYGSYIHKMTFEGFDTSLQITDAWNTLIDNNEFLYQHVGVDLVNLSTRSNIANNFFTSWGGTLTTTSCISITRDDYTSEGVFITNNHLYGSAYGVYIPLLGIGINIEGNEFENTINCVFSSPNSGITIANNPYMRSSGSEAVIDFPHQGVVSSKKTTVVNNYIMNGGTGEGIHVGENSKDFIISGNQISTQLGVIGTIDAYAENIIFSENICTTLNDLYLPRLYVNGGKRLVVTDNVGLRVDKDLVWIVEGVFDNNTFSHKHTYSSEAPTQGTWNLGDVVDKTYVSTGAYDPPLESSVGDFSRWICTSAGSFTSASELGTATENSYVITSMTDTSDFIPGEYVCVAGSGGFDHQTQPMQILAKTSTSLTLDTYAHTTASGQVTVTTPNPVFVVDGQNGYRSGTSTPSGSLTPYFIGEQFLDTSAKIWYDAVGTANTDWKARN